MKSARIVTSQDPANYDLLDFQTAVLRVADESKRGWCNALRQDRRSPGARAARKRDTVSSVNGDPAARLSDTHGTLGPVSTDGVSSLWDRPMAARLHHDDAAVHDRSAGACLSANRNPCGDSDVQHVLLCTAVRVAADLGSGVGGSRWVSGRIQRSLRTFLRVRSSSALNITRSLPT